ncbi:MAG: FAD-binding protein [Myxococcales bacterium]|nr:FAD-binding protein [Myxococcales bacterium]
MHLERALKEMNKDLRSDAIVTDPEVLEGFARDESEVRPHRPDAVVRVRTGAEVAAVMRAASAHRVPVTPRGGGTGRTGGAVPLAGGIVLAFEQANRIKGIEADDLTAVVEPGVVLSDLHAAVEAEGLFYPPDPNSLATCTLGGNVAENAAGPRTLRYGTTRDYVLGMQVVTADGTTLQLGKQTIKGVTGYDLASLVVGSEGTLAVTTELTVKLLPKPQAIVTLLIMLPDMPSAGRAVGVALSRGFLPRCVEMLDGVTLDIVRPKASVSIPDGCRAMLILELDGDVQALDDQLERCGNAMIEAGAIDVLVARHGGERERLWAARRELSHALRAQAAHKLAEDVVVPRSKIPELLDGCRRLSEQYRIVMPSYGHAGDGNIHVNFLWNQDEQKPAVDAAIEALFRQVIELGGTLSGEHGIGVLKAPYLALEQAPELILLQERIKDLFDPKGILNPGKIFPGHLARFHGPC